MNETARFRMFPENLGKAPYLWLIYWAMPIYFLFQTPFGWKALLGLSLVCVFLVAYRQTYWVQGKKLIIWVMVEVAIVLIFAIFWDPNYLYVGFFPATASGSFRKPQEMIAAIAVILISFSTVLLIILHAQGDYSAIGGYIALFCTLAIIPFGMRATRKWREMSGKLQEANRQIERLTKQEERQRIARDLHDTLGHTLSMITLKSQLAEKCMTRDPERAAQELKEIQNASRQALSQVRNLVSDMHAVNLQEEIASARQLAAAADMRLEVQGNIESVQKSHSSLACTIFAMCLRESLNNAVKHSGASLCTVTFAEADIVTEMRIADNGKGSLQACGETAKNGEGGHGLFGMRQRLELVSGTMDFFSEPGKGTAVCIRIPRVVSGRKQTEAAEA